MGYCTVDRDSNISNDVRVCSSDIEDSVVKTIYTDGKGLHVIDNHNCDTWVDTTGSIENNLDNLGYKIEEIEREYENQLQRQKVHISRGDRITGHRIHGRSRKVTIPKGCFRNQKGIKSVPITT